MSSVYRFNTNGQGRPVRAWSKYGGKRNTRKACKKQVNLSKTGGEICQSRGEE